jgi:uncharacterized membrane protein
MDRLIQFFFKHKWSAFEKGEFSFAGRPSWLLVILILALAGLLIYFLYIRPGYRINSSSKWTLMALRASLLAVLLIMIMRPVLVVPSVIPKSTTLAILADDSQSMKLADENNRTRIDAAKELMSRDGQFIKDVDSKFRLSLYGFSTLAARINGGTDLKAQGESTDLVGALQEAIKDSSGSPLSGIVVISDGGSNTPKDLSSELRDLKSRNIPVYTIGVGNPARFKDAELVRVTAPRRVLVGSAVSADALVRLSGFGATKINLSVAEDGKAIKTQQYDLKGGESQTVTIEFTPTSAGSHRYTYEVTQLDGETTSENNVQESLIEVTNDKPRVLFIDGEPRWEYGKLRFSLAKNEKNLVLVSVLRSADGKFYRQGVESGGELTTGFPTTVEELFSYQGLIIGSIEANFFSYEQLKNIEQFASKRGGGVLALGGSRSFDAGKFASTPLAEVLPFYLNDRIEEPEMQVVSNFRPVLTSRGRTHAITRMNEDRALSAKAWEEMPPISIPETLSQIKPGATLILEARNTTDSNRVIPLLAEQRYGRGRSMALTTSDTWRWRMELPSQNNYHETFWRQTLRYLVSTTPNQLEIGAEKDVYSPGDVVIIRSEVNDKKFDPITDATVTAKLTKPSGPTVDLPLRINYGEKLTDYRTEFSPDEKGLYRVELNAMRNGAAIGSAQSTFFISERTREFNDAAQNVELLKRVAAETGGKYYTIGNAKDLLDDVTMIEGRNSEKVTKELWDMPINFMLLIGLASTEWFLRKRKGLS